MRNKYLNVCQRMSLYKKKNNEQLVEIICLIPVSVFVFFHYAKAPKTCVHTASVLRDISHMRLLIFFALSNVRFFIYRIYKI